MDEHLLRAHVGCGNIYSDGGFERLLGFARRFVEAHTAVPGGLSVEVGTRHGGTATMFLGLLRELYPAAECPFLFTVDPYGNKPYWVDDSSGVPAYGASDYCAAKSLLAPYPNHTHFLTTSRFFFERLHGMPYWAPGHHSVVLREVADNSEVLVRVGEERKAGNLTFCLLDGAHDVHTIEMELNALFWGGWMAEGGLAVVDNVDVDPRTLPMLRSRFIIEESHNHECATVRGHR